MIQSITTLRFKRSTCTHYYSFPKNRSKRPFSFAHRKVTYAQNNSPETTSVNWLPRRWTRPRKTRRNDPDAESFVFESSEHDPPAPKIAIAFQV